MRSCMMVFAAIVSGCSGAPHTPARRGGESPTVDRLAVELAAYEVARPVFERWCVRCHTPDHGGGSMALITSNTFDISRYPFGGVHGGEAGYVVASVLGAGFDDLDEHDRVSWAGKRRGPPIMPRANPGAVRGDELERVLAWARAWRAAERADEHAGPRRSPR